MRSILPEAERHALCEAIRAIINKEGALIQASKRLGISAPALGNAVNHGRVGPEIGRVVEDYYGTDRHGIQAMFGSGDRDECILRRLACQLARQAGYPSWAIERVRKSTPCYDYSTRQWLEEIARVANETTRNALKKTS